MPQPPAPNPATPAAKALAKALADPCAVAAQHGFYMSPQQAHNLARLASYLRTLPDDYAQFEMAHYHAIDRRGTFYVPGAQRAQSYLGACGTTACAVGHGPAAGVPSAEVPEDWVQYADRAFISTTSPNADRLERAAENEHAAEVFGGLFGGSWSHYDNTPRGAAARIAMLLDGGVPAAHKLRTAYLENDVGAYQAYVE